MLQQTTVSTVLKRFEPFIKKFPTLEKLAKASEDDVLSAWEGLGYYRRARNLHKAAKYIYNDLDNIIPSEKEELLKIPGVGDYTASSLIAIGQNKKSLAVDANLERVISRHFGIEIEKGPKLLKEIRNRYENNGLFKGIRRYRALNEALMDLGRTYCQSRKVDCLLCPVNESCYALKNKKANDLPILSQKKKKKSYDLTLNRTLCFNKNGEFLVVKRKKGEWLEDQYELPSFVEYSEDKLLIQYPQKIIKKESLSEYKTLITKYKITNRLIILNLKEMKEILKSQKAIWVSGNGDHMLSSATKKALRIAGKMAKMSDKPDPV